MAKQDMIIMKGQVTEVLPDSKYRVRLENDHMVLCYAGGKIKKNKIKIMPNDRVECEISPYDVTKGRITWRFK
jgi:translation initiation factor IF-1